MFQYGVNTGFAAMQLTTGGISELYSIDLPTGVSIPLGAIGGGDLIDGIAVIGIPEPAAFGMAIFALIGGVLRGRKSAK